MTRAHRPGRRQEQVSRASSAQRPLNLSHPQPINHRPRSARRLAPSQTIPPTGHRGPSAHRPHTHRTRPLLRPRHSNQHNSLTPLAVPLPFTRTRTQQPWTDHTETRHTAVAILVPGTCASALS